jgi:hypothetical protein
MVTSVPIAEISIATFHGGTPMRITSLLALAVLLALTAHARAGTVDCGLFPDMHARFACYDNISRAPKLEPGETMKPAAEKPKAATVRSRKMTRTN